MTAQAPDWLVFRGRRRMLFSNPLEPRLKELPGRPDFRVTGTANWRGYVATWEVRSDDTLWLTGLQTRNALDEPDPGLKLIFPNASGPVAARWVSQRLESPDGDQVRYVHFGYQSRYARVMYLTVHVGRVILVEERHGETGERLDASFTTHLEATFGSDEGSFLRAAHASPADSAPRLVYADWLDERGDPRGELIRLAERIRGLDPAAASMLLRNEQDVVLRAARHPLWRPWSLVMAYDHLAGWRPA
jgi:uncharacterized protein (TIGR02996 family)